MHSWATSTHSSRRDDEVNFRNIRAGTHVQGGYAFVSVNGPNHGNRRVHVEVESVNGATHGNRRGHGEAPLYTRIQRLDENDELRTQYVRAHYDATDSIAYRAAAGAASRASTESSPNALSATDFVWASRQLNNTHIHRLDDKQVHRWEYKRPGEVPREQAPVFWNMAEERMEDNPIEVVDDKEKTSIEMKLYQARDWVDPGALAGLLCLMQTRSPNSPPLGLYSENIAPFLRFEKPLPNMLYAMGGRNGIHGPLNIVEMLDTWHGRWVHCPPMSVRRSGCAAAPLSCGRIVVVGGYDERGVVKGLLSSCESFDPMLQQWKEFAPLLRARWGHGCASLHDKVYAVGGCSLRVGAAAVKASMETLAGCEVYDPKANKWTLCGDLRVARASARAVVIDNRYIAAVGGCKNVFGDWEALRTVELLDPETNCWVELDTKLSVPRAAAATAAIDSHRILVFGGADRSGPALCSSEIYCVQPQKDGASENIEDDETSPGQRLQQHAALRKSQMVVDVQQSRMGCQALLLNLPSSDDISHGRGFPISNTPHVVIVGGESENHTWQLDSVLAYDASRERWLPQSPVPAMPTKRTALALCSSYGRISSSF
eukprot:gnl/MRDRNA2_/MRDRNA2_86378_c0_seq1.p1 gnl/MRDRNA2_/MRDRNA2_86378_c0~~gnl/MRDRNA2_/MRDRNA2_86378_c0_seq1.p1  ORF type:complete len:601 (+),score=93.91 gnl/MRDRNA2_/MRDRNA2_86378_c0_seq1:97-1899(+)